LTVIAFTRPERRLPQSISVVEAAGFTAMAAPSLEIMPCSIQDLEGLLRTIKRGDVVIFTSATSAEECGRSPLFTDSMEGARIISIGTGTAKALGRLGVATDVMPSEYSSEGIVERLRGTVAGKKIILIRSDHGSPVLDQGLRAMGADVVDFKAYSLRPADPRHLEGILDAGSRGKVDVFAFTSPMSAHSFLEAAENRSIAAADMLGKAKVAAIGRPTADMLRSLGVRVDIIPEKATFKDMIAAIKKTV